MIKKFISILVFPFETLGKWYIKSAIIKDIVLSIITLALLLWGYIIHTLYDIEGFYLFIIGGIIFFLIINFIEKNQPGQK